MAIETIDSIDDARVAAYRDIRDPDLVRKQGLFVAEGRLVVRRLVERGGFGIRSLLITEAARRDLDGILETMPADVPVYLCRPSALMEITGFRFHRGCLAIVERPAPTPLEHILASARLLVVLEGVADPDNVGGVFRNAAAFGVDAVLVSPTACDPLYRKAVRTSMGAALAVPFVRLDDWPGIITRMRTDGFTVAALTPRQPSDELDRFAERARGRSVALLFGSEGTGLTSGAEALADCRVRIPIRPDVDSLNLAVAAGIALHAISCGHART